MTMQSRWAIAVLCCFSASSLGQDDTDLWSKYQKDIKANPRSSITHFRMGEIYFLRGSFQQASNAFREALNGDLQPKWIEVWSLVNLGKIYDITDQRTRAVNSYNQAQLTNDNTRGAMEEAALYLQFPYPRK